MQQDTHTKNGDLGMMYHHYHTSVEPEYYEVPTDYHVGYDRVSYPYHSNETPMYVRPYLEDPVFLQPDDGEVALMHPDLVQGQKPKAKQHDLQGDPSLENPKANAVFYHLNSQNETPMYVRPYLEDPVFLQPDDSEIALIHPKKAAAAAE